MKSYEMRYNGKPFSYTGMHLMLKRKTMGHLDSAYYYPTSSFAILSMISYLIKPDMVSWFDKTTVFTFLARGSKEMTSFVITFLDPVTF